MENRVAIANFLEKHGDVDGALRCLQENLTCAEAMGQRWTANALQDLQLLCLNHPELSDLGLEVTDRLIASASDEEGKVNNLCDRADLLASAGRVTEAEEAYQAIFSAFPDRHFAKYRYALFLDMYGRRREAVQVLRSLLALDHLDRETRLAAKEVLQDWET